LKFADGTRSAKAVPSSVSAVAVNAWSPSSTPPSPPLSSPSPSAPFDWMGSPWLRGAQGLSAGSTHAVSSGGEGKRVGGLDAGLSCEGTWRCQIRPRALRRFAGHAPAGKINQRCSITVIH
jgi:hypothetical protein